MSDYDAHSALVSCIHEAIAEAKGSGDPAQIVAALTEAEAHAKPLKERSFDYTMAVDGGPVSTLQTASDALTAATQQKQSNPEQLVTIIVDFKTDA